MDINDYAKRIEPLAQYPGALKGTEPAICYTALGLAGEAGEVANQIKKILRDDQGAVTDARRESLKAELGDVAWYFAMLCRELGIDPAFVLQENVDKLYARKERGTIQGDGDKR
jgi:NTP pyrophosphatase (non-canonical NTP hydrolase)